jgi:hypothetical protein
MDPNTALQRIRELVTGVCIGSGAQGIDLAEAFEDLDGWLSKGGFLPSDWFRPTLGDTHPARDSAWKFLREMPDEVRLLWRQAFQAMGTAHGDRCDYALSRVPLLTPALSDLDIVATAWSVYAIMDTYKRAP